MNLEIFDQTVGPWLQCVVADSPAVTQRFDALARRSSPRTAVRLIHGEKCNTLPRLFDEFSTALQFPHYFGKNWAALDECLVDLTWFNADVYILLVMAAHQLLPDDDEAFRTTIVVLSNAGEEWSRPSVGRPTQDAKPFHTVLQVPSEFAAAFQARLVRLGLVLPTTDLITA